MSVQSINDYAVYNARMDVTMPDKCWWVDKIDDTITTVVDIGCGRGALGLYLSEVCGKNYNYIGVDNDPQMKALFLERFQEHKFFDSICSVYEEGDIDWDHTVVVMNSILHEIFSYSTREEYYDFFKYFWEYKPAYIAIRDMAMVYDKDFKMPLETEFCIWHSKYVDRYYDLINHTDLGYIKEENLYTDFFLKYEYSQNWSREKNERYLWQWPDIFRYSSALSMYEVLFEDYFYLDYKVRKIKEDFGLDWTKKTHCKMLLKIKN